METKLERLQPYLTQATSFAKKEENIGEIYFAKGVYQVEIKEGGQTYWPFLQISDDGELKEFFCTCDKSPCLHVAAAYLRIFENDLVPIHVRFFRSFWFQSCQLLASCLGYDQSLLGGSNSAIHFIPINSVGKKLLTKLIEKKYRETPETSLKFSNLPPEEIDNWKKGRPSQELRFLLSFWFDLALFLFAHQKEAKISFIKNEVDLPIEIQVLANGLEMSFAIDENQLEQLIPTFRTLPKGPSVHSEPGGDISSIEYDPQKQQLYIHHHQEKTIEMPPGVVIGKSWIYKSEEGFYPLQGEPFFKRDVINRKEIAQALTQHLPSLKLWCKNTSFFETPVKARYVTTFDAEWNLHFDLFINYPGDLRAGHSAYFDQWVYIDNAGFFPLEGQLFDRPNTTIIEKDVNLFIQKHRIWLNSQKGFETHLAHMDLSLTYQVDSKNGLSFYSKIDEDEGQTSHDFGEWIYFKDQGFFSKSHQKLLQNLMGGLRVRSLEIPKFIRENREDLEGVEGFFSSSLPLKQRGLKVAYTGADSIRVDPICLFEKGYEGQFFGDYLYLKGEGFVELPPQYRIPEEFVFSCEMHGSEAAQFLFERLSKLEKHIIDLDPSLKEWLHPPIELSYLVKSSGGGLKVRLQIPINGHALNLKEVYQAYLEGRAFYVTPQGAIRLQSGDFSWFDQLNFGPKDDESFELTTLEFLRLDSLMNFSLPKSPPPNFEISKRLIEQLRQFALQERPQLKGLKSMLRHYQHNGVNWLWFLFSFRLSGLLCDDMGLGKTHQAMGLMAAIEGEKKEKGRFIVVCPTSVIYHWEDKLAQFLPGMKVHTFHGQKRSLPSLKFEGVLLTSYGTLRVEKKRLKEFQFTLAIFDEVHLAKNAASITHSVLSSLQATMRLGLTGTPIENNLKELKALFDIVLPGLMPSATVYKEKFLIPIERDFDQESKALLSRMIKPFILRRRKQEVLTELPEKSEDKSYCELYEEQRSLYDELVLQSRNQFLPELRDRESKVSYIHIFSILGKLKQICNHPALYHKDIENYKEYSSGKWELFIEKFHEDLESGQKVVVFSQYLGMLDIIKLYLCEIGVEFAEIRGDTKDRREQLKLFKDEPNCMIFLGSLQAAGLGIDLTAAEVVIFYDRWWNAARENQATDRVHRMGQKRGVQVYKLITKDTLEEKIDALITKKGRLLEEVVGSDDQAVLKTFTRSELIEILTLTQGQSN